MRITESPIHILGVPMDLGASRRGTDSGPSALRIAGMRAQLRGMGYRVGVEEDVAVPAMETRSEESANAHYKEEILAVCSELADRIDQTLSASAVITNSLAGKRKDWMLHPTRESLASEYTKTFPGKRGSCGWASRPS